MTDSDPRSNSIESNGDDELSPEALGIIQRARRSFGYSIAILLLGFVAIVGALVYRAVRDDDAAQSRYELSQISLPIGAQVLSVATDRDALAITYSIDGAAHVRFVQIANGDVLGEIALVAE